MARLPVIESRIPWPRGRYWRPGEPITLTDDGVSTTYLLRGVFLDAESHGTHATVLLEPIRSVDDSASSAATGDDLTSAVG